VEVRARAGSLLEHFKRITSRVFPNGYREPRSQRHPSDLPRRHQHGIFSVITSNADQVQRVLAAACPLKQAGYSEDIANMVRFLASDEAQYITGQAMVLDGGVTAGPDNGRWLYTNNGYVGPSFTVGKS